MFNCATTVVVKPNIAVKELLTYSLNMVSENYLLLKVKLTITSYSASKCRYLGTNVKLSVLNALFSDGVYYNMSLTISFKIEFSDELRNPLSVTFIQCQLQIILQVFSQFVISEHSRRLQRKK